MRQRTSLLAMVLCAVGVSATVEAGERAVAKASGQAQTVVEKPYSRFCKAGDLVGTWRLVKFDSQYQFKDPHAPYLMPHQLFSFSKDGVMKSAHSPQPFRDQPARVLEAIPSAVNYSFEREGMVALKAKGMPTAAETWHCVAITEDRNDVQRRVTMKRGDLVMTLVGQNGQPVFIRQLRK